MRWMEKRSLRVGGKPTSIALEPQFWAGVTRLAQQRDMSIPALITAIASCKPEAQSLASAIRCAVLDAAREAA